MGDIKQPILKPLSDLNLLDRFLFACAMEDIDNMELVLKVILGKEMKLLSLPQAERELRTAPWLRSVRLDVLTMDEQGFYNAEVQKKNTGSLPKRGRFYQALMDSQTLIPGEVDFNQMPDVTLITIAPFDLFGEGKYRYTFRMKCEESEHLRLGDGAVRIFLNTRGTNDREVGRDLVELLHYFEHSTDESAARCTSEHVRALHEKISRIKANEKIGVRYMQAWEEKVYERLEGSLEHLTTQVTKKLAKGKTVAQIAEDLEEDEAVIAKLVKELTEDEDKAIDDTDKI